MQIKVRCGCGDDTCPEWAIVELQGVVEPQASFSGELPGLEIGRLCCSSTSQGSYTFTVGYHELSGTKMPLKKPLLVLKKKRVAEECELEVIGVVRHRILFKNRPKALISTRPPPSKKSGRLDVMDVRIMELEEKK